MEKGKEVKVINRKRTDPPPMKKPKSNQPISMEMVLMEAVQQGMDANAMEKLVGLIERRENKLAENEFNDALSKAQSEMKPVKPTGFNQQTSSEYPKLEEVNAMAMPIATKYGFSLSCTEEESKKDGYIKIAGTLSHSAGHSRPYSVDLPLDDKGIKGTTNKTKMHATGSTFTYGRRYLTVFIFHISILGADDDGNVGGGKVETKNGKLITKNQAKKITAMINGRIEVETLVMNAYEVATIDLIPAKMFDDCIGRLEAWNTKEK